MTTEELSSIAAASKAAYTEYDQAAWAVAVMADMDQDTTSAIADFREKRETWQKASARHMAAYEEWRAGAEQIRIALAAESSIGALRQELAVGP